MSEKLKQGDIITVKTESVLSDFKRDRDFRTLKIESAEKVDIFAGIEELSEKSIYQVVEEPIHNDLAKLGVKVNLYTLNAQKIESLAFVKKGEVLVNGEFAIPFDSKKISNLSETYFFNEVQAQIIATELNKVEREHLKTVRDAAEKGVVMLDQIISGARV